VLTGGLLYSLDVGRHWGKPRSEDVAPWFVPAASTILVLTGLQLITSWLLKLILGELSQRESRAKVDLGDLTLVVNETAPERQLVESLTK
jgi:hypothetical protein